MKRTLRGTAAIPIVLACLVAPAAFAQDAGPYLEKMLTMYEQPFSAEYTLTMNVSQGGMQMSMDGTGEMVYRDQEHMLMDMTMTMEMPNQQEGMEMSIKTVSDGTFSWTEMNNPMTGQQVMKMDLAKAQEMASQRGMSANPGSSPLEQLRTLQEYFDFQVAEKSDGEVKLVGQMKSDAPAQIQQAGPMAQSMTVVVDETTGRVHRFEMGPPGGPGMVMNMTSYQPLSESDVPDSRFSYTPPEGVTVIDPLAMQGGQGPPGQR